MTNSIDTARARAEAIYRAVKPVPPMEKQSATAEYKAAQGAVRLRMAQQRAASLAKEAGTLTDPAVKLKAKGKKRKQ